VDIKNIEANSHPAKFFWIINLWGSFQNILEQQYVLAKKCNMSIVETNLIPDFEREIYINMLLKDIEEERKHTKKNKWQLHKN
jgi:hypothetical protein